MNKNKSNNTYDDDNIPDIDTPKSKNKSGQTSTEPLPESERPRQDGPGGE